MHTRAQCNPTTAAHTRVSGGDLSEVKDAALASVVDQLREGVGEAAGTHIVNELNGRVRAHGIARVNNLLASVLLGKARARCEVDG